MLIRWKLDVVRCMLVHGLEYLVLLTIISPAYFTFWAVLDSLFYLVSFWQEKKKKHFSYKLWNITEIKLLHIPKITKSCSIPLSRHYISVNEMQQTGKFRKIRESRPLFSLVGMTKVSVIDMRTLHHLSAFRYANTWAKDPLIASNYLVLIIYVGTRLVKRGATCLPVLRVTRGVPATVAPLQSVRCNGTGSAGYWFCCLLISPVLSHLPIRFSRNLAHLSTSISSFNSLVYRSHDLWLLPISW